MPAALRGIALPGIRRNLAWADSDTALVATLSGKYLRVVDLVMEPQYAGIPAWLLFVPFKCAVKKVKYKKGGNYLKPALRL